MPNELSLAISLIFRLQQMYINYQYIKCTVNMCSFWYVLKRAINTKELFLTETAICKAQIVRKRLSSINITKFLSSECELAIHHFLYHGGGPEIQILTCIGYNALAISCQSNELIANVCLSDYLRYTQYRGHEVSHSTLHRHQSLRLCMTGICWSCT